MLRTIRSRAGRASVVAVAVLCGAAGVSYATTAVTAASTTTIEACLSSGSGVLYLLPSTGSCRGKDTPIAWNVQGPAGRDGTSVSSASASTLPPGSAATASFDAASGNLALGIPSGAPGANGADGKNGVDGKDGTSVASAVATTLAPGSAATAAFDPASGVLSLGIPRGDQGAPGAGDPAAAAFIARFGTTTDPADAGRAGDCMLGSIQLTAGTVGQGAPADGKLLSIVQNTALFSLLGTTYGGDGRTTFALPDLRPLAPNGMTYMICDEGIYPSRR